MSARDFNHIKSLRDCPVEILLKIDGVPITVDFTDGVFRMRTKRSDWIYDSNQFLEYARQNPKVNFQRACNYKDLFEYIDSLLYPILFHTWNKKKKPLTYEVLFEPMMTKNKHPDSLTMVNKKYPVKMMENVLLMFDHERNIDPLTYSRLLSILPCYKGIIEISRLIEYVNTKEELHDFLRDYAMKYYPINEFELEGYVFYFPKLEKRFKVFV